MTIVLGIVLLAGVLIGMVLVQLVATRKLRQVPCTGVAARWCPVHGDCECEVDEDGNVWGHPGVDADGNECPLHGEHSHHAEARP